MAYYGIELYSNNASTTLASSLSNTSTTLVLASGTGALFPSPSAGQFFRMSLTDASTGLLHEIVYGTARSTDTVTIVRAQEGTSALAWNAGDIVINAPTAGAMQYQAQSPQVQQNIFNYAADTGTANAYVVNLTPASLTIGVPGPFIAWKVANGNTGASTITVSGGATYPLLGAAHTALLGGELIANGYAFATYNSSLGTGGSYVLIECTGAPIQIASGTNANFSSTVGQVQTGSLITATAAGTANALTATIASSASALVTGQPFTIMATNANTGATTLVLTLGSTVLTSLPIVKANNTALVPGDIPAAGYPILLNYSSTFGAYVIQNPATGFAAANSQLTPLTATASSGAITVSLAATTLTYRSTTLTTGSGTTVSQSALTLNIPLAASLGGVTTIQQEIVILSAYNAGTPVLAAANISGGLDLSETGLISPTTISSSATSNTVIYSQSSVSANTSYRVVGYLLATWTSGTGWVVSQVQPYGGQALATLQSFGMGQTWQNLTASRANNTTYYNTTARTISVSVSGGVIGTINSTAYVNGNAIQFQTGTGTGSGIAFFKFEVQPGASYSVNFYNGVNANGWWELR